MWDLSLPGWSREFAREGADAFLETTTHSEDDASFGFGSAIGSCDGGRGVVERRDSIAVIDAPWVSTTSSGPFSSPLARRKLYVEPGFRDGITMSPAPPPPSTVRAADHSCERETIDQLPGFAHRTSGYSLYSMTTPSLATTAIVADVSVHDFHSGFASDIPRELGGAAGERARASAGKNERVFKTRPGLSQCHVDFYCSREVKQF